MEKPGFKPAEKKSVTRMSVLIGSAIIAIAVGLVFVIRYMIDSLDDNSKKLNQLQVRPVHSDQSVADFLGSPASQQKFEVIHPESAATWRQARSAYDSKNYQKSIELWQLSAQQLDDDEKRNPSFDRRVLQAKSWRFYSIAKSYFQLHDYKTALQYASKAIDTHSIPLFVKFRARIYDAMGNKIASRNDLKSIEVEAKNTRELHGDLQKILLNSSE